MPGMPSARSSASDAACPCRFESFLPSSPRTSPWWITSGNVSPSAAAIRRWTLVRTVIGAPDHVRDPELQVVDDRRELVGGGPVRAHQRRPVEPGRAVRIAHRSAGQRALRSNGIEVAALALSKRPLVPQQLQPGQVLEDRRFSAGNNAGGIGVVDPKHERTSVRVRESPVRDRAERVADVKRPRRGRREADADGHVRRRS